MHAVFVACAGGVSACRTTPVVWICEVVNNVCVCMLVGRQVGPGACLLDVKLGLANNKQFVRSGWLHHSQGGDSQVARSEVPRANRRILPALGALEQT